MATIRITNQSNMVQVLQLQNSIEKLKEALVLFTLPASEVDLRSIRSRVEQAHTLASNALDGIAPVSSKEEPSKEVLLDVK